jgi:hypothetical protein
MTEFTYTEARQKLAALLERARIEGAVRIRRHDGQVFVVRPEAPQGSLLDLHGLDLGIEREEVVGLVRSWRTLA